MHANGRWRGMSCPEDRCDYLRIRSRRDAVLGDARGSLQPYAGRWTPSLEPYLELALLAPALLSRCCECCALARLGQSAYPFSTATLFMQLGFSVWFSGRVGCISVQLQHLSSRVVAVTKSAWISSCSTEPQNSATKIGRPSRGQSRQSCRASTFLPSVSSTGSHGEEARLFVTVTWLSFLPKASRGSGVLSASWTRSATSARKSLSK